MWVKLETSSNCLIGSIDKICISQNRIYLLDKNLSKSVFAFDLKGRFISKYDKRGKGPDEFVELNDMSIANDSVFILMNNGIIGCFNRDLFNPFFIKLDCWARAFERDKFSSGFAISGNTYQGDITFCNFQGKSTKHYLVKFNTGNMNSHNPFSNINGCVLFHHPILDTVFLVNSRECISKRVIFRDKSQGFITYYENSSNIIIKDYSNKFYFYNKANKTSAFINAGPLDKLYNLLYSYYQILGIVGDYYISLLEPTRILDKKFGNDTISFAKELKRGLSIESNPIVILTKFR